MHPTPLITLSWAIQLPGRAITSWGGGEGSVCGNGTTGTSPDHPPWLTPQKGSSMGSEGSKVEKHHPERLCMRLPERIWPRLHGIQCCLVSLKLTLSSALSHRGQDPSFWAKANPAAEAGKERTEPASEKACGFPNILQSKAKPAVLTCCEQ